MMGVTNHCTLYLLVLLYCDSVLYMYANSTCCTHVTQYFNIVDHK